MDYSNDVSVEMDRMDGSHVKKKQAATEAKQADEGLQMFCTELTFKLCLGMQAWSR